MNNDIYMLRAAMTAASQAKGKLQVICGDSWDGWRGLKKDGQLLWALRAFDEDCGADLICIRNDEPKDVREVKRIAIEAARSMLHAHALALAMNIGDDIRLDLIDTPQDAIGGLARGACDCAIECLVRLYEAAKEIVDEQEQAA